MYVIIVYDVREKRVAKVCQFLRQYLNWIQNSVFEGELTKAEYYAIRKEIEKIIDENEDSIIFYIFRSKEAMKRETIGITKADFGHVI